MNPAKFPEVNQVLAKNQPEYIPLPVCIQKLNEDDPFSIKRFIFKYELSDLELEQIKRTKSVFFMQFGQNFHPVNASIESPFKVCVVNYKSLGNKKYAFAIDREDGSTLAIRSCELENVIDKICRETGLQPEELLFKQVPNKGIDEHGNIIDL